MHELVTPAPGEPQKVDTPPEGGEKKDDTIPDKKVDAVGDPSPEHPAWKELYGQKKVLERQLETMRTEGVSRDTMIKSVQDHNRDLQTSMDGLEDKFSAENRPNPVDDPEGYGKWTDAQIQRGVDKAVRGIKESTVVNASTVTNPGVRTDNDDMKMQRIAMESTHNDYTSVVNSVTEEISGDSVLRNEIMNSSNPPKAAYEYGLKRMKGIVDGRNNTLDQGFVESGTLPAGNKGGDKPTTDQEVMARNLGIPIDKYMEQKKQIDSRRT